MLAKQPAELLERLRGRVAHVHISDCDGKVHGDLPPGRGVVDFPPYLQAIKALGLDDATVSIELEYSPEPDRIVDWVREAYESTAGLMRRRGCGREVDSWPVRRWRWSWRCSWAGRSLATVLAAWDRAPEPTGGGLIAPLGAGERGRPRSPPAPAGRDVDHGRARRPRRSPCRSACRWRFCCSGPTSGAGGWRSPWRPCWPSCRCRCSRRPGSAPSATPAGRRRSASGPILAGRWGAAFIHAMAALPWIVLLGGVGLRSVEPELEESALLDLPAWRVLVQVTLRRSAGALAGAALAVAVLTAGDMTVTDLLQVRTYAEEAYIQYQLGHGPEAAAAVTLLPLLVLGTLVALMARGLLGADPARLASAVGAGKVWRLGRWRVPLGVFVAVTAGPIVALPLYSLVWWAGRVGGKATLGQGPHWSLGGLAGTLRAATADAAGPLAVQPGLVGARRHRRRSCWPGPWPGSAGRPASGVASSSPASPSPSPRRDRSRAWRWCSPTSGVPVFDSPSMIVLADVVRTLPFALLVLWPGLRTIPPAWLDAAAVDGHGEWGQIRRVALPATRDALARRLGRRLRPRPGRAPRDEPGRAARHHAADRPDLEPAPLGRREPARGRRPDHARGHRRRAVPWRPGRWAGLHAWERSFCLE